MSKARSLARSRAVQALYQWQVASQDIPDILAQFLSDPDNKGMDADYFQDLVRGVLTQLDDLDQALSPLLDRGIERVDLVERAILRLGTYEFRDHPEIPYKVVIDEAVELAKTFGAEQGHRYINGVLDKLASALRPIETASRV